MVMGCASGRHTKIKSEIKKILFSLLTFRAHARWVPLMGRMVVVVGRRSWWWARKDGGDDTPCLRGGGVVVELEAVEEIGDGAATSLTHVCVRERAAGTSDTFVCCLTWRCIFSL